MSQTWKGKNSTWQVVARLRSGGQGTVYEVRREDDHGAYVLKLPKATNPRPTRSRLGRFLTEIEILGKLSHPSIIRLEDTSPEPGSSDYRQAFYVTRKARGGSLQDRKFFENKLETALLVFRQICQGLAAAHAASIVHRDIKPANILFDAHELLCPMIIDFGIAYFIRPEGAGDRLTLTDEVVGPRWFMAPEFEDGRAEPDVLDARADVYSAGKVLYYMLSGGARFAREKHRDPRWNLLYRFRDERFELINGLLDRMIVEDRDSRFPAMVDVLDRLDEIEKLLFPRQFPRGWWQERVDAGLARFVPEEWLAAQELERARRRLEEVRRGKEEAAKAQDFEKAAQLRGKELILRQKFLELLEAIRGEFGWDPQSSAWQ